MTKVNVTVSKLSLQNLAEKSNDVNQNVLDCIASMTERIAKDTAYVHSQLEMGTPEYLMLLYTLNNIIWNVDYLLQNYCDGGSAFNAFRFSGMGAQEAVDNLFTIRDTATRTKLTAMDIKAKLNEAYCQIQSGKAETITLYAMKF